jgi:hypothetical protein
MLNLTNIPHHFAQPHENDPPRHLDSMMTENTTTNRGKALAALHDAVLLYGNIPNEFPTF